MNRLAITVRETKGTIVTVVEERGASPLTAAGRCHNRSPRMVACADDGGLIYVDAGRGDDRVAVSDPTLASLVLRGGAGADHLTFLSGSGSLGGGPGSDTLLGAGGRDLLYGGPGRDRLRGGPRADFLSGDAGLPASRHAYPDSLDGGPGHDLASWGERRQGGVVVDLAGSRLAGAPGEHDRVHSIEDAVGTAGPDRLIGDAGANRLYGRGGEDLLVGREGPDRLDAGTSDPLNGGAPDGDLDRFRCGKGKDVVEDPALEALSRDCEGVAASAFSRLDGEDLQAQPRPLGGNRYAFEAICSLQTLDCRRRVVLLVRGRVLARSPTVRTRRERTRIVVRLRRPLPRSGQLEVRIEGEDREDNDVGPRGVYRWYAYVGFRYRVQL